MDDSKEMPSTSKYGKRSTKIVLEDDSLTLHIKNEEAEIALLKLPDTDKNLSTTDTQKKSAEDECIPKLKFQCEFCDMCEMVHYYGKEPPFVLGLKFAEDTYVMRDPFQPPPPRWKPKPEYFIALGADCFKCRRTVCKDLSCSIFYTNTFCLDCAAKIRSFPSEMDAKVSKQLSMKKT